MIITLIGCGFAGAFLAGWTWARASTDDALEDAVAAARLGGYHRGYSAGVRKRMSS